MQRRKSRGVGVVSADVVLCAVFRRVRGFAPLGNGRDGAYCSQLSESRLVAKGGVSGLQGPGPSKRGTSWGWFFDDIVVRRGTKTGPGNFDPARVTVVWRI